MEFTQDKQTTIFYLNDIRCTLFPFYRNYMYLMIMNGRAIKSGWSKLVNCGLHSTICACPLVRKVFYSCLSYPIYCQDAFTSVSLLNERFLDWHWLWLHLSCWQHRGSDRGEYPESLSAGSYFNDWGPHQLFQSHCVNSFSAGNCFTSFSSRLSAVTMCFL